MSSGPIQCPICGRADSSQRISAIVGNGTRTTVTQQSFFSALANNRNRHGFVIPQRYTSTSVNGMTNRLAAPGRPWPALGKEFWSAVGISAGIGFLINILGNPVAGAISSALLGGAAFYVYNLVKNWPKIQKARQIHQGRLVQYYESYYCKRDDVCFMPGVYSAQPEQYKSWLFQYN